jgi:hypothetical protein
LWAEGPGPGITRGWPSKEGPSFNGDLFSGALMRYQPFVDNETS